MVCLSVFFFKQKTAYDMRISDWSSDVCSSDLAATPASWGTSSTDAIGHPSGGGLIRVRGARLPADAALAGRGHSWMGSCTTRQVQDRKSVVEGKRESVRVALGGCLINKKKKKTNI